MHGILIEKFDTRRFKTEEENARDGGWKGGGGGGGGERANIRQEKGTKKKRRCNGMCVKGQIRENKNRDEEYDQCKGNKGK